MADGVPADRNVFRINVVWRASNQLCQTGFYVREVAFNDNTPEDVVNTVKPWVDDHLRGLILTTDDMVRIDCLKVGTEEGFTFDYVGVHGSLGVAGVAPLPTFICANIALKTQRRKRYGQGRMFWPVRDENMVTGDTLIAAAITTYQGVIDELADLFTGDPVTHDLILCAYHDTIPELPATPSRPARAPIPAHWYDIAALKLNTAVTSMRSRKVGIGI